MNGIVNFFKKDFFKKISNCQQYNGIFRTCDSRIPSLFNYENTNCFKFKILFFLILKRKMSATDLNFLPSKTCEPSD